MAGEGWFRVAEIGWSWARVEHESKNTSTDVRTENFEMIEIEWRLNPHPESRRVRHPTPNEWKFGEERSKSCSETSYLR